MEESQQGQTRDSIRQRSPVHCSGTLSSIEPGFVRPRFPTHARNESRDFALAIVQYCRQTEGVVCSTDFDDTATDGIRCASRLRVGETEFVLSWFPVRRGLRRWNPPAMSRPALIPDLEPGLWKQ